MGDGLNLAVQVCWNCKNGKRKCSKDVPACARCSKLLLKCDYEYSAAEMNASKAGQSPASSVEGSTFPQLQSTSKLMHALSDDCSKSFRLEASIPTQVLNIIISNGDGVPSITSTYFRTIDVWLPVISADCCIQRLERITQDNNVELAGLLLCMFLVTRPPGNDSDVRDMQTALYYETKTLYTFLVSSGKSSIEIIQAGLLLGLYEIGHGITEASQITMAVCLRMAMKMKAVQFRNNSANIQNTEFGRLWWGIVTLDRYMNQDLPPDEIHLLVGSWSDGVPSMELPVDEEALQGLPPPISMRTTSGISASHQPTTRLGPFCRAAEAGHLLGQVLDIIAHSSYSREVDFEKSRALDHAMQSFAMVLVQQAINGWEECCAAIGLCLSAMILLHEKTWNLCNDTPGSETRKEAAGMALSSAIRMTVDISRRFHMDLAFIDLPALPLPATYAIYRATLLYIKFSGDSFQSLEWSANMDSLKSTLGHFAKRWSVGKHYLELIDVAISNESKMRARASGRAESLENHMHGKDLRMEMCD
ncbi:hypothetical protein QTJ16_000918 [Diplocarpon rosae]|uniref:Zn(2)-C6 fungal-type domain-containing protein n=1 Tax=Diplocarpon rosae TaxID=946125 RepID=A0AAD9T502_9HELO|nr:hypothetical protein QTJ16_000918 [Diplocarpon rosae]